MPAAKTPMNAAGFLLKVLYAHVIYLITVLLSFFCAILFGNQIDIPSSVAKIIPVLFILIWLIWLVFFCIAAIRNLARVILLYRQKNDTDLLAGMKYVKYRSIPFFILNFALGVIMFFIFLVASHGMGILLVPIPVSFTWICMIATSFYGFAWLLYNYRNGLLLKKVFVRHFIMHFLFVFDIISTWLLAKRATSCRSEQNR
ncbi:MAG: hypothetical protein JW874_07665 [Spirochaetales bacterium]|nr:hypothetical protein [Spirochaetales bacterium]